MPGPEQIDPVPATGGPFVFVTDLESPELDVDDHHHLARVRRVGDGESLILGDGSGRWRSARFSGRHPAPDGRIHLAPRASPEIGVAFALVKGAKPELVVQKLVELGVDRIRPFVAARSVVRWDAAKADAALVRWRKVAREAAMQSRRAWPGTVEPLVGFDEAARTPGGCRAERDGDAPSLDRPLILVGPEGGWDEAERTAPIPSVGLGPNVLRAETAAITAGALLAALRAGLVAEPS